MSNINLTEAETERILRIVKLYGQDKKVLLRRELEELVLKSKTSVKYQLTRKKYYKPVIKHKS